MCIEQGCDDTRNELNLLDSHAGLRQFEQQLWYQAHAVQHLRIAAVTCNKGGGTKQKCHYHHLSESVAKAGKSLLPNPTLTLSAVLSCHRLERLELVVWNVAVTISAVLNTILTAGCSQCSQ